jgi:histidyl-tRNA synthetase
VRKAAINAEVYPDAAAKMKKQMSYADDKKIPFVVIVGSDEMKDACEKWKDQLLEAALTGATLPDVCLS